VSLTVAAEAGVASENRATPLGIMTRTGSPRAARPAQLSPRARLGVAWGQWRVFPFPAYGRYIAMIERTSGMPGKSEKPRAGSSIRL
jgi:hypothetical protein